MLGLTPVTAGGRALRVLCLGAHCDDIDIGCGGTLLQLQAMQTVAAIDWVVFSGDATRRAEATAAFEAFVGTAVRGELVFGQFPDGSMPGHYSEIKAFFEALKDRPAPDLVFTHERDDRHQDHRLINEMTWNTFRDQLVLEYEIPKWDGGLGQPNVYMPLAPAVAEQKVRALLDTYRSQASRDWFSAGTFEALLRLRGIECRAPSGFAEAFHGRKIRLGPG